MCERKEQWIVCVLVVGMCIFLYIFFLLLAISACYNVTSATVFVSESVYLAIRI